VYILFLFGTNGTCKIHSSKWCTYNGTALICKYRVS